MENFVCKHGQLKRQCYICELESELRLYKMALTQAVSLPKGSLPSTDEYYTWLDNGNCTVSKRNP